MNDEDNSQSDLSQYMHVHSAPVPHSEPQRLPSANESNVLTVLDTSSYFQFANAAQSSVDQEEREQQQQQQQQSDSNYLSKE